MGAPKIHMKTFRHYDEDRSGFLEKKEAHALMRDLHQKESEYTNFDKDGDKKLSKHDVSFIKSALGEFRKYDKNRSGILEANEVEALCKGHGHPGYDWRLDDADGDGGLSQPEFIH